MIKTEQQIMAEIATHLEKIKMLAPMSKLTLVLRFENPAPGIKDEAIMMSEEAIDNLIPLHNAIERSANVQRQVVKAAKRTVIQGGIVDLGKPR